MNKIPKKVWIIIAAAVVLIAVGVVVAVNLINKDEAYRTIMVYQINGKVVIDRDGVGEIDAYENLILQSGDGVKVSTESNLRLKLDDDKYIMVEPDSELTIYADGNKADSKTKIELTKGAITNEIQGKLNDSSSYEVTTPNSIMAVRGTTFRVAVELNENGESYTNVATFDGNVASRLVMPDGTVAENEVEVTGGKQAVIKGTVDDSEYVVRSEDINYDELPKDTLDFLLDVIEGGENLSISSSEIEAILGNNREEPTTEEPTTEEPTGEEETSGEAVVFVVTFMYDDNIYGTQEVVSGELAAAPLLSPAVSGEWDYDFTIPVTEDITIEWK